MDGCTKSPTRCARSGGLAVVIAVWLACWPVSSQAARGDCGQPVSDGALPTASDCLYMLRAAVDAATCDPECICNVNDAGGITAADALLCLRKAVDQPVVLNCGEGCTSTTTTVAPPLTTALVVFTKMVGTYATPELAGTWDVNGLGTGPVAPSWNRGSLVVQSNGSFSGTLFNSDGETDNVSGKLALSAQGVLTCTTSECPDQFQGAMDAGKTFMPITHMDDGSTRLLVATKRAGSYGQANLGGSWGMNNLTSTQGVPEWERGALTIQTDGALSGSVVASDGSAETASATLQLSSKGKITCTSGCGPDVQGALDSGKDLAALTYSDDGEAANLMILCRRATEYSVTDLAGTWRLNELASGEDAPLWVRGSVDVQSNGAFAGNVSASNGANRAIAGTLSLSADGIVTMAGDEEFRCFMDADKTVMVCTASRR